MFLSSNPHRIAGAAAFVALLAVSSLRLCTAAGVELQEALRDGQSRQGRAFVGVQDRSLARAVGHEWYVKTMSDNTSSFTKKRTHRFRRHKGKGRKGGKGEKNAYWYSYGNKRGKGKGDKGVEGRKSSKTSSSKGKKGGKGAYYGNKRGKGKGDKGVGGRKKSSKTSSSKSKKGSRGNKASSSSGDDTRTFVVRVPDVAISYDIGDAQEPTDSQIDDLVAVTTMRFEEAVASQLPPDVRLIRTESFLDKASYNSGFPEARYNFLTEYEYIELSYIITGSNYPPGPSATFSLLRESITEEEYIFEVRTLEGFEETSELFFFDADEPPPTASTPPPTSTPTVSPPTTSTPTPISTPTVSPGSPTPTGPTDAPTFSDDAIQVRASDVKLSYTFDQPTVTKPSDEEIMALTAATVAYYDDTITEMYADNKDAEFLGVELAFIASNFYAGSGTAEDPPTLTVEYEYFDCYFAPGSTDVPSEDEAFATFSGVDEDFIADYVLPLGGSFEFVDSVEAPIPNDRITVRVTDVSLRYTFDQPIVAEPAAEETAALVDATIAYYEDTILEMYAGNEDAVFLGVDLPLSDTTFDAGSGTAPPSYTTEFGYFDCYFAAGSTGIPSEDQAFETFSGVNQAYIADYVLPLGGAFEFVDNVVAGTASTPVTPSPTPLTTSFVPSEAPECSLLAQDLVSLNLVGCPVGTLTDAEYGEFLDVTEFFLWGNIGFPENSYVFQYIVPSQPNGNNLQFQVAVSLKCGADGSPDPSQILVDAFKSPEYRQELQKSVLPENDACLIAEVVAARPYPFENGFGRF